MLFYLVIKEYVNNGLVRLVWFVISYICFIVSFFLIILYMILIWLYWEELRYVSNIESIYKIILVGGNLNYSCGKVK